MSVKNNLPLKLSRGGLALTFIGSSLLILVCFFSDGQNSHSRPLIILADFLSTLALTAIAFAMDRIQLQKAYGIAGNLNYEKKQVTTFSLVALFSLIIVAYYWQQLSGADEAILEVTIFFATQLYGLGFLFFFSAFDVLDSISSKPPDPMGPKREIVTRYS